METFDPVPGKSSVISNVASKFLKVKPAVKKVNNPSFIVKIQPKMNYRDLSSEVTTMFEINPYSFFWTPCTLNTILYTIFAYIPFLQRGLS